MAYPKTHETAVNLIKDLDKDIKIIDLGCGQGEIVKELRRLGFKNIEYCDLEDIFDGKVKLMDFNKPLKYEDNSFDLAICIEVVEHLENKYHFFRDVKRILKKDSLFVFSTPNISNLPNRLLYLLKAKFIEFNPNEMPPHINPFFLWELPKFLKIKKIVYNRGFIPVLRIPFISNSLFGQTIIVKCKVDKK